MKKNVCGLIVATGVILSMAACGSSDAVTKAASNESSEVETFDGEASNVIDADEDRMDEVIAPTVLDYGYIVTQKKDKCYVKYAYEVKNENNVDIDFPKLKVTARDESGAILFSDEVVCSYLSAGDTEAGSMMATSQKEPASFEIVGVVPDEYNIIRNPSVERKSTDFEVFNVSIQGSSVTGEVKNVSSIDYDDGVIITAIFRDKDGHIITGATSSGMFDKVAAGETTTFDIQCLFDPAEIGYDTVTVTAMGELYDY